MTVQEIVAGMLSNGCEPEHVFIALVEHRTESSTLNNVRSMSSRNDCRRSVCAYLFCACVRLQLCENIFGFAPEYQIDDR